MKSNGKHYPMITKFYITIVLVINFFAASSGSKILQMTRNPAHDYHPKWSPDGKTILFTSQRNEWIGIWTVSIEWGPPRPLDTGMRGDHHISWSHDAKHVMFFTEEGDNPPDVWLIPAKGGEPKKVLPDIGPEKHITKEMQNSKLQTEKFALLVIDMQDEFVKPHWSPDWVPEAAKQAHRIKKSLTFEEITAAP